MGAMKKMMMAMVVMAMITAAIGGEVYMVGDDHGWTSVDHYDYKSWASKKLFRVGDTIVFRYVKLFHNVVRVSYTDYITCNGSNPITTFTSGNDSIPIKYPGHYFFICTEPGHCAGGQKVDIRVPYAGGRSAPRPTPSPAPIEPLPFPYPQPYAPSPSPVTPSQSPALSQSPAPSLPDESDQAPTPAAPGDEVAPAPQKNKGSQVGFEVKIWTTIMVVCFYLIGFSF